MRTIMTTIFVLAAAVLLIGVAMAGDDATKSEEKVTTEQAIPLELKAQTHCPVMGGKINSSTYTDIQGQRVYHCCPGCSKALKKDPDKFFKKAAADGILFENIQTTCPISGEELEAKTSFVDFEGRRVFFCCDKCQEPFAAEPKKFLEKLDQPAVTEDKAVENAHEGHNH